MGPTIHILPSEVLSHVFLRLEQMHQNPFVISSARKYIDLDLIPYLRWLCVTHVCSQWRETALKSPALWANYVPDHPMLVAAFLERSKDKPIALIHLPAPVIKLCQCEDDLNARYMELAQAWYETVKPHLYRTEGISIQLLTNKLPYSVETVMESVSTLRSLPDIPHLRNLTILISKGLYNLPGILDIRMELIWSLPWRLSYLRALDLNNCALDWERIEISDLTCLKVMNIPWSQRISTARFLQLLACAPHIETLVLSKALEDWDGSNPSQQVLQPLTDRLSHLRTVNIDVDVPQALLLFDSIAPSEATETAIQLDGNLGISDDIVRLGACIRWIFDQSSNIIIKHSPHIITLGHRSDNLYDESYMELDSRHGRITDLVGGTYRVLRHISLTGLQCLSLPFKISSRDPQRYWKEFFLLMTELKTLIMRHVRSARRILELLTQPIDHDFETLSTTSSSERHKEPHYLLPQLQEVILDESTLHIISNPSATLKREYQEFLVALELFVRSRAAINVAEMLQEDIDSIPRVGDTITTHAERPRQLNRLKMFLHCNTGIDTDGMHFQRIRELVTVEVENSRASTG